MAGAYLVKPGSKDFMLCMATLDGIIAPKRMVLQVLVNLYGLPSSGRNFSKAVDAIVLKLAYKNTPYDPKFRCKWIGGIPILVVFHTDDFRWCGPPHLLAEWDSLVAAFKASRYKVKDCTKEPFLGINVTSDEKGNFNLDQKKLIESAVKAAKVSGAKVQKLSYPLHGTLAMLLASASVFALSAFDNEGLSSGYDSFCTLAPLTLAAFTALSINFF